MKRTLILSIALMLLLPAMIPSTTHASKPEKVKAWIDGSVVLGTNRTKVLSLRDFQLLAGRQNRNITPYSSLKLTGCKTFSFRHPFPKSVGKLTEKEKQLLFEVLPEDCQESTTNVLWDIPLWLRLCEWASTESTEVNEKVTIGTWPFDEKDYRYWEYGGGSDPYGFRAYLRGLVSPASGKIIRTDCASFSPGNMFIRKLSKDEIRNIVKVDPEVDYWWKYSLCDGFADKPWNYTSTLTGKRIDLNDPIFESPMAVTRAPAYILYVRLYGEKGVLFEGLL